MSLNHSHHPPYEVQLKDFISGQTISLNEWIQHELFRIQNNIEPRHCQSYSELVQVIEEPSRFQTHRIPLTNSGSAAPNALPYFFSSCAAQLHNLENIRRSLIADNTKQPTSTILCHAFLLLLQSCRNTRSPRQLLYEFDKLRLAMKQKKEIDPTNFRVKLMSILFGKIQLTEQLIKPWQLICQWMATSDSSQQWIQLSTGIFIIAKRLYIKKITLNAKYCTRLL
ncbi:unnamed protein product [Rhizopus stolonifer]